MREWGWTNPVLVDEAGSVIAGHGRILAARQLGFTEVPVMVAVGWTEAQRRAYLIADNQLGLNAGWDFGLLKSELQGLRDWDFDLGLLGFKDLDALLAKAGLTDPDEAPEPPQVPVSALGDVWLLGAHRLVCGDSTAPEAVARALDGVKPHLMVTDPPYGVSYDPTWRADAGVNKSRRKLGVVANDDRADWREAWALFPGVVAYCWHAAKYASTMQVSLEAVGFEMRAQIIWAKDRFALSRGDYHWQHEPCWYAVRKGAAGHWLGNRSQTTLWQIPAREDGGHGHGTQKPVECMRRPIENNSSPGQAVLLLAQHDISYAIRNIADFKSALDIFRCYRGKPFRFKNWADFAFTQVNLGTGNGVITDYPLRIQYSVGTITYNHPVYAPVAGTISVYVNAVLVAISNWSLVAGTADTVPLIRFNTAPAAGLPVTASFQKDDPVVWATDLAGVEITSATIGRLRGVMLWEVLKNPDV
jgi:uncharacterized protein (TIGR02217 family)